MILSHRHVAYWNATSRNTERLVTPCLRIKTGAMDLGDAKADPRCLCVDDPPVKLRNAGPASPA